MFCLYYFFFFKQKTAYEMRISDWSSDVCSSDLLKGPRRRCGNLGRAAALATARGTSLGHSASGRLRGELEGRRRPRRRRSRRRHAGARSEEHTSELQSLMRISYAVFCLQKKKKTK